MVTESLLQHQNCSFLFDTQQFFYGERHKKGKYEISTDSENQSFSFSQPTAITTDCTDVTSVCKQRTQFHNCQKSSTTSAPERDVAAIGMLHKDVTDSANTNRQKLNNLDCSPFLSPSLLNLSSLSCTCSSSFCCSMCSASFLYRSIANNRLGKSNPHLGQIGNTPFDRNLNSKAFASTPLNFNYQYATSPNNSPPTSLKANITPPCDMSTEPKADCNTLKQQSQPTAFLSLNSTLEDNSLLGNQLDIHTMKFRQAQLFAQRHIKHILCKDRTNDCGLYDSSILTPPCQQEQTEIESQLEYLKTIISMQKAQLQSQQIIIMNTTEVVSKSQSNYESWNLALLKQHFIATLHSCVSGVAHSLLELLALRSVQIFLLGSSLVVIHVFHRRAQAAWKRQYIHARNNSTVTGSVMSYLLDSLRHTQSFL